MSSSFPVQAITTVDYHTAGEPFRIVLDGVPEIPGSTVGERRVFAQESEEIDRLRRLLCHEPRGHADMYGGFLTPADDDGADFGVLFWHKDGFSTACGHGTIALGVWAVETGRVTSDPDGETIVTIDVPSGRVEARVLQTAGRITSVTFRNGRPQLQRSHLRLPQRRGCRPRGHPPALHRHHRDRPGDQVEAQRPRIGPAPDRPAAFRGVWHHCLRRLR